MAEVFPQLAHGEHDAEGEDVVDLDLRQRRLVTNGWCFDGATIEDAVDAADEALQGRAVELVGASEAVHDASFGSLGLGVPDVLGGCC